MSGHWNPFEMVQVFEEPVSSIIEKLWSPRGLGKVTLIDG